MTLHDRLLRAKERWAFADGYHVRLALKIRAAIWAFFESESTVRIAQIKKNNMGG